MDFEWILQVPVLFFSIIVHEFCHGFVAYEYGDSTAEHAGRLTFDPLAHVDLFGTILLPALCVLGHTPLFGWAKPVPVDPSRMRGKYAPVVVAAVGPAANVALAALSALALRFVVYAALVAPGIEQGAATALRFGVSLNLYLAAFNLLPVFPLDGSQVVAGLLPRRWAGLYEAHAPYGFLIILVLLMTGLLGRILFPLVWLGVSAFSAIGLLR